MIIKRRVTRGFVQIANEVVRDRRLALDEHGLLHYLLSLPDNWEVNLKQIETYWSIGKDRRQRIFRALRKAGWAQLERITTEDGQYVGQRWIIGDEPGPEATDDAVSEEETRDDEEAREGTPTSHAAPESQAPDASESACREPPFPAVGQTSGGVFRPPDNTALPRTKTSEEHRESTNTGDARLNDPDDDGEPPPLFGELLRLWPADHVISAFACERLYAKFSDRMRVQARDGIKPYLADCRSKGQRICDLKTYLDERRYERFVGETAVKQMFACKRGTPQADRWRKHFERFAQHKITMFDQLMRSRGEYTTESEWPPAIDPEQKSA